MNKSITSREIAFILYCPIVSYGIVNLPKDFSKSAKTGGWICLFIITLLVLLTANIIVYLNNYYKNQIIYDYSKELLGKFFMYILFFIYTLYFFIFFSMVTRMYCNVVHISILVNTPVWVLSFVFFCIVYYALSKGSITIARVCQMYAVINILGNIIISIILFTQGEIINLTPVFPDMTILEYLKGVFKLGFPFLGLEVMLFIPVTKDNCGKIFKMINMMVILIAIIYLLIGESTISLCGPELLFLYKAPLLNILRGIDVRGLGILRRMDGIYIIIWSANVFCSICVLGNTLFSSIKYFFKFKNDNMVLKIIVLVSFVVAQIPNNINYVEKIIKYNSYLGYICLFIIPYVLFCAMKIKSYGEKTHGKKVL